MKKEVKVFNDYKEGMQYMAKTYAETPDKFKAFHDLALNEICKVNGDVIIIDELHILD